MSPGERTPEERERDRLERERRRQAMTGGTPPPPPTADMPAAPLEQSAAPEDDRWDSPHDEAAEPDPHPASAEATYSQPPPPEAWSPEPADEFEPPPPPPRPTEVSDWPKPPQRPRMRSFSELGLPFTARHLAIGVIAIVALSLLWAVFAVFQPFAGSPGQKPTIKVEVPRGASVGEIGDLLASKDIVNNGRFFAWRANWSGRSADFKAGRYKFAPGVSYSAAIDALAHGPNAGTTSITVVEGRSRYEIARQLNELGVPGDYMDVSKRSRDINLRRYGAPSNVQSLEGFLFPATYEFESGATAKKLVEQQLAAFKQNIDEVRMSYARDKNLTVFDVVTIASLIEREVQKPSERRLVAAVIYNRLKQGIPLGIDATTRFETRNWNEPLANADLQRDTPYNTRTRKGLPPGPIGNPGLESLKAAARPAKVGYLYYVANPCKPGSHSFSSSDAEFQKDVERYNRLREAANGQHPSGC